MDQRKLKFLSDLRLLIDSYAESDPPSLIKEIEKRFAKLSGEEIDTIKELQLVKLVSGDVLETSTQFRSLINGDRFQIEELNSLNNTFNCFLESNKIITLKNSDQGEVQPSGESSPLINLLEAIWKKGVVLVGEENVPVSYEFLTRNQNLKVTYLGNIRGKEDDKEQDTSKSILDEELLSEFLKGQQGSSTKTTPIHHSKINHRPLDTVNFLANFSSDNTLKFATHDWDENRGEFNYDNWIKKAKSRLFEIKKTYSGIPGPTFAKVRAFILESDYFDANRNKVWGWGFDKIRFGWSSPELVEWCKKNPQKYPRVMEMPSDKKQVTSPEGKKLHLPFFEQVINKFKREIQFRNEGNHLLTFLRGKMRVWGVNEEHSIEYDEDSLEGLSFFVDVDRFASGLKQIMHEIKIRPEYPDVLISGEQKTDSVELKIFHKHSKISRHIDDEKVGKSTLSGNFKTALDNLISQCDWSFEGPFIGDESWKINYLTIKDSHEKEPSDIKDGVLHTFVFYKPTI